MLYSANLYSSKSLILAISIAYSQLMVSPLEPPCLLYFLVLLLLRPSLFLFHFSCRFLLKISVGSSVLIQCKKAGIGELFSAIVSDVEDGSYDVIFDDERLGEEGSMDISRIHILAQGNCSDIGSDKHHDIEQVLYETIVILKS